MKLLYFLYSLKRMSWEKCAALVRMTAKTEGMRTLTVALRCLLDFIRYDTYFLDYFYLRFFALRPEEKRSHASTLLMYRFQKLHNQRGYRPLFRDKVRFLERFRNHVCHDHHVVTGGDDPGFEPWLSAGGYDRIVAKDPLGAVGTGVTVFEVARSGGSFSIGGMGVDEFLRHVAARGLLLVEQYIVQHPDLMAINGACLNTIRAITVVHPDGKVELVSTILRTGLDKTVDNFDAGGISALIDKETGIVSRPGIVKDPFSGTTFATHPVSGGRILGARIPFWPQVIELVSAAAVEVPEVRTVGWDVVVTEGGPHLLEGNDNWDKTHWELCEGRGFRERVEAWMAESPPTAR